MLSNGSDNRSPTNGTSAAVSAAVSMCVVSPSPASSSSTSGRARALSVSCRANAALTHSAIQASARTSHSNWAQRRSGRSA